MTVAIFAFIAAKTTYEVALPSLAHSQGDFNRRVRGAFSGLSGGFTQAGDIKLRPNQNAITNHLLCDGSTLNITDFPQLYDEIGTTFGGDGVTTFALPDYSGQALTVPGITVTQTVTDSGTVSTGGTVTQPSGSGQTGGSTGGNILSGGRTRRLNENEQLP